MRWTQETAENMLAKLHMEDLPLMEIRPRHVAIVPDWFPKYKSLCREFIKSLTDSVEEIAFMQLSQEDFMAMLMGKKIPENLSIRFRIPLQWGGKLEIDNLFMCRTFPHSDRLDKFIISQKGNETIWLPNPVKKIYVSAHTAGGGEGGNTTSDRLSQLAAQLAAQNSIV